MSRQEATIVGGPSKANFSNVLGRRNKFISFSSVFCIFFVYLNSATGTRYFVVELVENKLSNALVNRLNFFCILDIVCGL